MLQSLVAEQGITIEEKPQSKQIADSDNKPFMISSTQCNLPLPETTKSESIPAITQLLNSQLKSSLSAKTESKSSPAIAHPLNLMPVMELGEKESQCSLTTPQNLCIGHKASVLFNIRK
jgi:hypothetical protein